MSGKKSNIPQVIKKGILATLLWGATGLGALFIVAFFAIQIPQVQTKIVKEVTDYVTHNTGHEVKIGYVNISWFDSFIIEEMVIKDQFDSTMISSNQIIVDFSLIDLVTRDDIYIDALMLNGGRLYLQKVDNSTSLNLVTFLRALKELKKGSGKSKGTDLFIGKVKFEDSFLSILDHRVGKADVPWNYNDINYEDIDCSITGLTLQGDSIKGRIDHLSAHDSRDQLNIQSLSSAVSFTDHALTFKKLRFETDHSIISDSVAFIYSDPSQLSFIKDSVDVRARFKESLIHPYDIQLFYPKKVTFKEPITVSGDLEGRLGRFELTDLKLQLGNESYLSGYVHMIGLPNARETFMEIDLKKARLISADLKSFAPDHTHAFIDSLKTIRASASFLGFYSDFVAKGSFNTDIGRVESNLNLKLPYEQFPGSYKGQLSMENFDLGLFLGDRRFGLTSMAGAINGKGFDKNTADLFLNADFKTLEYANYPFQGISTNAELASEFFQGKLTINDPNLQFNIDGTIDLRENVNKVDFSGNLDTLNLQALRVTENDYFLSTKMDLDFTGLELDSIYGFVDLHDIYVRNGGRDLALDSLKVVSQFDKDERTLLIQNELLNFSATGKYANSSIVKDVSRLLKEYQLIINNDQDSLDNYYSSINPEQIKDYIVDIELDVSDADPFIRLFTDKITLGKNTSISGELIHGETSIFKLNSNLDTLLVNQYLFYNNEFDLNVSKITHQKDVLSMFFISSEKQVISELTSFNDFYLEAIWSGDEIEFTSNLEQTDQENKAKLNGIFGFKDQAYELKINNSELTAIGKNWGISKDNLIRYNKEGSISFKEFGLLHQEQSIFLNGELSENSMDTLDLKIHNFQLENINPLINQHLSGVLNTEAEITGWGSNLLVQSDMGMKGIELNDFLVGDIEGVSRWENSFKRLRIGFEVDRLGRKVLQLGGYFYPRKKDQFDIVANFDGTSLKVIQPFVQERFSNLDGELKGQFTIEGDLDYPILKGEGEVGSGQVTVDYLNTDYTFNGEVIFEENEVGVRNLNVRDINNNLAIANGGVFHDGFRSFVLDISAEMESFQVLNTSALDNDLYYGTANLTGEVSFLGSFDNLRIEASATTNRDTKIYIPLGSTSNVEQEDFITFVNLLEEKKAEAPKDQEESESAPKIKGIQLDFDLDITPDAYTELIFDIKSGDIIRGRGNGKINLQINTDGDFLVFGDLVIENGGYNFTLKNIINKEFKIIEGSKITWYGDPYQGEMDIMAEYSQLTSLLPLINQDLGTDFTESAEARRKYPAVVELKLDGPLLSPAIDFDIRIDEYPESISGTPVAPIVNAFNSKLDSDEQELKRQVFSLIVLRRFSPANSFNVGGGQTLGSSVSEFISNQLSYWVSQVDENLEIDVDLTSLDQDAFNTFQLRLAYTFLNGRLKVSRDGGFTNVDNEADLSAVVGDWTVEYLITADGKLRAKMYNRTNYNVVDRVLGDQNNNTTGFSLRYTKSFDQFRELLFKARKQPKIPKENPEDPNREIASPEAARIDESKQFEK